MIPVLLAASSAVTYDIAGGRFGDQILSYLHAKWIAYYYEMPLLFKPFIYSDQLYLHKAERHFRRSDLKRYKKRVRPTNGSDIDYGNDGTLYVIPYFPESLSDHTPEKNFYYFTVDWKESGFKSEIKKMITPLYPKTQLEFPADRISVAVHVRLGGGFDTDEIKRKMPLKMPPESFYKEQIRHIYELLDHQPLYVYVFTDDQDPPSVMERLQDDTRDLDIQYDCRREGNAHNLNVLEDFLDMTRFECLIRPESNYSIVAEKIADFRIVISPAHFTWTGPDIGYVDEVFVDY